MKLRLEIMLRDLTRVRFLDRLTDIRAGKQEVLVGSNHSCLADIGCAASLLARLDGSTIYLYVVLAVLIAFLVADLSLIVGLDIGSLR